jgi:hypothetical protein
MNEYNMARKMTNEKKGKLTDKIKLNYLQILSTATGTSPLNGKANEKTR